MPPVHQLLLLLCLPPFLLFAAATSAPKIQNNSDIYPSLASSLSPPRQIQGGLFTSPLLFIQLPKTSIVLHSCINNYLTSPTFNSLKQWPNDTRKKKRRKNAARFGKRLRGGNQKARSPVPPAVLFSDPVLDDDVGLSLLDKQHQIELAAIEKAQKALEKAKGKDVKNIQASVYIFNIFSTSLSPQSQPLNRPD